MLHYALFPGAVYGVRCRVSRRMILDRVRRKRLRLGVLSAVFFVVYIAVYRSDGEAMHHLHVSEQLQQLDSLRAAHQDTAPRVLLSPLINNNNNNNNNTEPGLFYTSPNYPRLQGQAFSVSASDLHELRLFPREHVNLTTEVVQKFVFATAASFAFFDLVKEAVFTVQTHRPNDVIYVYDLGLTQMQAHEIQSMCRVIYRKFGFSIFPKHVSKKFYYAWKPLIIVDVLSRHPGVFWMDASVRLITGDFSALLQQVQQAGGALSLTTTGHSTYGATHPDMYKYLPPGDSTALKREEQREATLLLYRTEPVMNQVVKWMVLCALDPHCIAPPKSRRGCVWAGADHFAEYGHCHSYDQSAFNILMLNYRKGKSSKVYYAATRVCEIERFSKGGGIPKYCGGDKSKEDLEIHGDKS